MRIILYSGRVKRNYLQALRVCKEWKFDEGRQLLDQAEKMLAEVHRSHVALIQQEASGYHTPSSFILDACRRSTNVNKYH